MPPSNPGSPMAGSIRMFRLAGITVSLHWSWLLVAVYEVQDRAGGYGSLGWNVAEYLALFGIVLLHEFGHAFACRSVGGQILQALLWFVVGRASSLLIVSVIGLVVGVTAVVVTLIGVAAWDWAFWNVVIAGFVVLQSWIGFQRARLLAQAAAIPRHRE